MTVIPYGKQSISEEDIEAVCSVLRSDWLTQGPKVKEFEEALAERCGAGHCVTVSNGTLALHLACLLEVLEAKEPKGLYKKARKGEILNFTGISDPSEDRERNSPRILSKDHPIFRSPKLYLTKVGM